MISVRACVRERKRERELLFLLFFPLINIPLYLVPEFLKAKCLMNCEVALILEHKYEQLQQMSEDPMNQVSQ